MTAILAALSLALAAVPAPAPLEAPGFGRVVVHPPEGTTARVVLFLSGNGGLDADASALAAALASRGALVVAVDTPGYLARPREGRCLYPAGDLESLAQHAEKEAGLDAYLRPILVGHSRGAAVLWAALAQAPEGTFAAGVSLAPCPELPVARSLCAGAGPKPRATREGELPAPDARPSAPLAVLAGERDRTCPAGAAEAFARARGAAYTALPLGHALAPTSAWADAIEAALARVPAPEAPASAAAAPPASAAPKEAGPQQPVPDVKGLPVVEVPPAKPGTRLAVLLTGDGGWVGLDKGIAGAMSQAGVAVVGLDSLKYFWKKRTPDETARDVARIIGHYRSVWSRPDVLLVGYSRGGDIVPFLPPRFPPEIRDSIRLVAMLGPETYAEFEVHVIDLFASRRRSDATSTEAAVRALQGERVLCVQGSDETRSVCPKIEGLPGVKRVVIQGGHHFDWDYPKLARMILDDAA